MGLFFDYSSLAQAPRTEADQAAFTAALRQLNRIFSCGAVLVVGLEGDGRDYMGRAWCFMEYFIALVTGALVIQHDQRALDNRSLRAVQRIGEQVGDSRWAHVTERARANLRAEANFNTARLLRTLISGLHVTNGSDRGVIYRIMVDFFLALQPRSEVFELTPALAVSRRFMRVYALEEDTRDARVANDYLAGRDTKLTPERERAVHAEYGRALAAGIEDPATVMDPVDLWASRLSVRSGADLREQGALRDSFALGAVEVDAFAAEAYFGGEDRRPDVN